MLNETRMEFAWQVQGRDYAVFTSTHPGFLFPERPPHSNVEVVLSRFAYVHRDGGHMVLESPEALCRVRLVSPRTLYWLALLARPVSPSRISRRRDAKFREFVALLWEAGFLEEADGVEPLERAIWEFHDLLFHWQTREGRVSGPQGATFRFLDRFPPPPAVKAPMSSQGISLPVPLPRADTFLSVLERRRSVREQGRTPISVDQLAHLLYHVGRTTEILPGECQDLLRRPVPAAGAIHELEFYLVVGSCDGLPTGIYHYHGAHHALYLISSCRAHISTLLDEAAMAWAAPDAPPQVLVILASRMPRLGWKYEGISYRLTLLNAGVVIQSLYLVATDLGIACSALGGGNSTLFAAATGLDPLEETSVAEFAIGSLPP